MKAKNHSEINQRIAAIVTSDESKAAFCRKTGIPHSTISAIVGERQSEPSYSQLVSIAQAYKLSYDWLMEGKGDKYQMLIPEPEARKVADTFNFSIGTGSRATINQEQAADADAIEAMRKTIADLSTTVSSQAATNATLSRLIDKLNL